MASFCDNNWYDSGCATNCVPQDSCDGHYTCDPFTGAKLCLRGYSGPQCDVPDLSIVGCTPQQGNYPLLVTFNPSNPCTFTAFVSLSLTYFWVSKKTYLILTIIYIYVHFCYVFVYLIVNKFIDTPLNWIIIKAVSHNFVYIYFFK